MNFLRGAAIMIVGLLMVIAVAGVGIGFFLAPQTPLRHADAIVAISGGETDEREQEAVKLYKEGYAPVLIFSGAAQDQTGPSNAATMRREAMAAGVPANNIYTEENSTNTEQNAQDTKEVLGQINAQSIILVTSPYHQRRASLDFHKALGPNAVIINHSAPDRSWRKNSWWATPYSLRLTLSELQKTIYEMGTK